MPPRKPVKSLQELTFTAVSNLTLTYCELIEDDVTSQKDMDLPFDSDKFKKAVETLRQHLRSSVAPPLWEALFDSTLALYKEKKKKGLTVDIITVYSVFVFDQVNLYQFTMPEVSYSNSDTRRVAFWERCAAMLPNNLVEVDVSCVRVSSEEILKAICQACKKLQVITLPRFSAHLLDTALELIVENCTEVKKILVKPPVYNSFDTVVDHDTPTVRRVLEELKHVEYLECRLSGEMLDSLDIKLKLKKLCVNLKGPEQMGQILNLCPDLTDLEIRTESMETEEICRETFHRLASSSHTISNLSLSLFFIDSDAFEDFMSMKGINIIELSLVWCKMTGTPRKLMDMLSNCPNLTKFTAACLFGITEVHLATSQLRQMAFPSLKYIAIMNDQSLPWLSFLQKLLENCEKLSTLRLALKDYPGVPAELPLEELFANPALRDLNEVKLRCGNGIKKVSAHLLVT